MRNDALNTKSYAFAIKVVKLSQYLQETKKEFVLSRQILRSGTAIGALIRKARFGESKSDFTHKMSIALKEANETDYWLCILKDTGYLGVESFNNMANDCNELFSMLASSVKTSKTNNIK